jgi:hypothetical protein
MSDAKLTIRVPQTWLDTLKHAAIDRRTTATAIVLEAVTQYLTTKESAKMIFAETTYTLDTVDYPAVHVTWSDLKAAGFTGDGSDDKEIETALLAAGAPEWVKTAQGWIDERGYGLYNTIVYSDALCEAFNLADLEAEFGTVDVEGNTYYLTQQAYITGSDDDVCYEAAAIASNGDVYTVRWAVCEDWQEIEDESDRCDWAKPISVTPA